MEIIRPCYAQRPFGSKTDAHIPLVVFTPKQSLVEKIAKKNEGWIAKKDEMQACFAEVLKKAKNESDNTASTAAATRHEELARSAETLSDAINELKKNASSNQDVSGDSERAIAEKTFLRYFFFRLEVVHEEVLCQ